MEKCWDVLIVGGGAAGLSASLFAAERGLHVLLMDHASKLGGSLWVASGQMSAAGTALQKKKGIIDSAEEHFADVMRISRGTADAALVRLAVRHAGETYDWLESVGFKSLDDHPVKGNGHEPYTNDRYYWGKGGGRDVVDVLVPKIMEKVNSGEIDLHLETEAIELIQTHNGAVTGIIAKDKNGQESEYFSKKVVLACGGYSSNAEMFFELNGFYQYTNQPYPFAKGAGLKMGVKAGGYLRGHDKVYNNFGSLFEDGSIPSSLAGRVLTYPEMRLPWEIYVNQDGNRFVKEDIESVDAREVALSKQINRRYWIIFDQKILDEAPSIILNWAKADIVRKFDENHFSFIRSDSLEGLANKAGINVDGLLKTVSGYNYGVDTKNDFFGRKHLPLRIESGPFYALRMQGAATSSTVGLAVNDSLQVINKAGNPIPNLFAAGELLGAGQTMGQAACGGMMVTPALTFGRLLGSKIL